MVRGGGAYGGVWPSDKPKIRSERLICDLSKSLKVLSIIPFRSSMGREAPGRFISGRRSLSPEEEEWRRDLRPRDSLAHFRNAVV